MRWVEGGLLFIGLALAGSDGAWFPWLNLIGMGLFFGFTTLVKRSNREDIDEDLQADLGHQDYV
jgi:hypothetical protein